jgi:hypothetical protein
LGEEGLPSRGVFADLGVGEESDDVMVEGVVVYE